MCDETKREVLLFLDTGEVELLKHVLHGAARVARARARWFEGLGAKGEKAEQLEGIISQLENWWG